MVEPFAVTPPLRSKLRREPNNNHRTTKSLEIETQKHFEKTDEIRDVIAAIV